MKYLICPFILMMVVLSGCSDASENEQKLQKEVKALQNKVDELEKEKGSIKEKEVSESDEKQQKVVIIDPQTKEEIQSLLPEDFGYGSDENKYEEEIKKLARDLARGKDEKPGYDRRMFPDKLDDEGNIIKGTPRVILEEEELVENILAASANGGSIQLPLYTTTSGYKEEDAAKLDEVLLSSYSTTFNSAVEGRTKNIELSAKAIHNVIVGEDDIFSFNTTVGPSDEEHGYQPAEEAVNGKLVMGIGGGICQTSSTLFNAIDQLAVEYVEKHHHSVTVGYVPKGRDATVSYGGLDFRFQNTIGVPILLQSKMANNTLTIEIRTSAHYAEKI